MSEMYSDMRRHLDVPLKERDQLLAANAKLEQLELALKRAEYERVKFQHENQQLQRQLSVKCDEASELASRVKELELSLKPLLVEKEKLELLVRHMEQERFKAQQENQQFNRLLSVKCADVAEMESRVKELEQALSVLAAEKDQQASAKHALQKRHDQILEEAKLRDFHSDEVIHGLTQRLKAESQVIQDLNQRLEAESAVIKNLNQRLLHQDQIMKDVNRRLQSELHGAKYFSKILDVAIESISSLEALVAGLKLQVAIRPWFGPAQQTRRCDAGHDRIVRHGEDARDCCSYAALGTGIDA